MDKILLPGSSYFYRGSKLATAVPTIVRVVLLVLGMVVTANAHPPDNLMKVAFELRKDGLVCVAEVHHSQLYSLERIAGGQVKPENYPAILKSFRLNCPVIIDGKRIDPTLISCEPPNGTWDKQYLDHAHQISEVRIVRVTLRYPLVASPEEITCKWNLIPTNSDSLSISFAAEGNTDNYVVSRGAESFTWKSKAHAKREQEQKTITPTPSNP